MKVQQNFLSFQQSAQINHTIFHCLNSQDMRHMFLILYCQNNDQNITLKSIMNSPPQIHLNDSNSHAIQVKYSNSNVFNQNHTSEKSHQGLSSLKPLQSIVCQIHETEKAIYFTADQPSVKFCKQCALNKALCGHQIQKCFDETQFEKKENLTTLMQGIKSLIDTIEAQNKYLVAKISDIRNHYDREIDPSIQAIDQLIKQLTQMKSNLSEIYTDKIQNTINGLTARQSKVQRNEQDLKIQLENVENSYCDLISGDKDFNKYILVIKETIEKAERNLYKDLEKEELNNIIQTATAAFIPDLERIIDKKYLFDDIVKPTYPNPNQANKKIFDYADENKLKFPSQTNQIHLLTGRNTKSMMADYQNLNVRNSQRLPSRNFSKKETTSQSNKIGKASKRESVFGDLSSAYLNAPLYNRQKNFCL